MRHADDVIVRQVAYVIEKLFEASSSSFLLQSLGNRFSCKSTGDKVSS